MKSLKLVISFVFIFVAFSIFSNGACASSKTDYDYQWAKYRENYSEFSLLKRDYLSNPTLDNQQKAMLSARHSLLARDMAKAAYARYLMDLINNKNTGYKELDPILSRLDSAATYFTSQAQLSQQFVTPTDLKKFAIDYYESFNIHERSLYYGQVAAKVASLVRFQIDAKDQLDAMTPKLPAERPAALQARLDDVPNLAANINSKIAFIVSQIIGEDETGPLSPDNYFEPIIVKIEEVRQLQLQLVNQFIDIDINYVQPKI